MDQRKRSGVALGTILILVGALILVFRLIPQLAAWLNISFSWPLIIIGVGLALFIFGLLFDTPSLAIPACIVGGIGGILYWQNATNRFESWAYAWTLIPGFVGAGIILAGLVGKDTRESLRSGGGLIFTSLVLFAIFGAFFGGMGTSGYLFPALLILLGLWMLFRGFLRSRQ